MESAQGPAAFSQDLSELRAETLRSLALLAGVLGYGWLVANLRPSGFLPTPAAYLGNGLLILSAVASYCLHRRLLPAACALLLVGSLGSVACAVTAFSSSDASYLFILPVAFASVLLDRSLLFPFSGLTCLISVLLGLFSLRLPAFSLSAWLPSGMVAVVAFTSWLVARNLCVALAWVWSGYERANRNEQDARQQQAKLRRALKALDEATYRLDRTNHMLTLARDQAEEARRLKQQFAQTISHELRTPLNLIVGFTGLMVESPEYYGAPLQPGYLRDLSIVRRNACHLQNLVNDVLDLARIEAAQLSLVPEEIAPSTLVLEAVTTARSLVESSGLELHAQVEPDLPSLWVDPTRIRQVLFNLLNNAARFTPQGSVTVRAFGRASEVVFSVADTGVGIAPEDKGRIFDEFHQVDGKSKRSHEGAGLGLAISRRFVELHRGRIWVESQVGQGSTFYFSLPVGPPGSAPAAAMLDRRNSRNLPPASATELVLLAVTRSPSAAGLISRYVQGFRTVVVQDLDQARQAARRIMPQAIIIDRACYQMGPAELEKLGRDWQLPRIPFVACPLSREESLRARLAVDGYLIKPITKESLWDTLRRFGEDVDQLMVIDDDRDFTLLLSRLLEDSPVRRYQVKTAHSAREGLAILAHHQPDLLLLDLMLPDIDGYQILARLRSTPESRHLPVVVISGQDEIDSQEALRGTMTVAKGDGLFQGEIISWLQHVLQTTDRTAPGPPTQRREPLP